MLNAANEVAVAAFLEGRIRFTDIAPLIERVLEALPAVPVHDLESVLEQDRRARAEARRLLERIGGTA